MTRSADVIVVGGGVIGCAASFELARRGVKVLLVDHSLPGRATSASAGGLWPVGEAVGLGCGVIYHGRESPESSSAEDLQPLPDALRALLETSNAAFPNLASELRERTGIDIEYEKGAGLVYPIFNDRDRAFVEQVSRWLPAAARPAICSAEEIRVIEPALTGALAGGAVLAGEHQVNPMLLAEAFKRAAMALGTQFAHHTRVTALRRRGDRVVGVETQDEFLPCQIVVNAAGAWAGGLAATIGVSLPVEPVRGQIVLTEAREPILRSCVSTSACYLMQKKHGEILIGSTTEHAGFDIAVTPEAIRSLCRGAVRVVPGLASLGVKRVWSGLRPGTPDELPILGPVDGLAGYVNAAGGFRTGVVAAPETARIVGSVVCGEAPGRDLEPFLLRRFDAKRRKPAKGSVAARPVGS
jgi:hydrogen cyanide synthase HcnC